MKRFGNISPQVETNDNFRRAFYNYARQKMSRKGVQEFDANLDHNIERMLEAYAAQTWHTSGYVSKDIEYPKHRQLNKLPVIDHVMQHAALNPVEDDIRNTIYTIALQALRARALIISTILLREIYSTLHSKIHFIAFLLIFTTIFSV